MGCHLIGIGGTGAKTVEAVVRLCAAGLGPDHLSVTFVDPDTANGNVERATQALHDYQRARGAERMTLWGNCTLQETVLSGGELWTPFDDEATPTLREFLGVPALAVANEEVANLLDVLYSDDELKTSLEQGFRGHPSIGSAVMATRADFTTSEQFSKLKEEIEQDVKNGHRATVVLVGSIFGGTGASGFPTFARLIRAQLDDLGTTNARLGGVLLLPYFSFPSNRQTDELAAQSDEFLLSTQAALEFYHESGYHDLYDQLYVVGDSDLSPVERFSLGAGTQKNAPHFVELYAALAALNVMNHDVDMSTPKVAMLARRAADVVDWDDLPDGQRTKQALGQLVRFSVAFREFYHPLLKNIRHRGQGYRAPWFFDLVDKVSVGFRGDETSTVLDNLDTMCEGVMDWCHGLHMSAENRGVELLDCATYRPKFDPGRFGSLVRPEMSEAHTLTGVWDTLCEARFTPNKTQTQGIGTFIRALYDACGRTA